MAVSEGIKDAAPGPLATTASREALGELLRKMPPVCTGSDGAPRYLKCNADPSPDGLLYRPLAELVPGEKAEVKELGRVSITVPVTSAGSETAAQVLAQIYLLELKYIGEVKAFALDDFDKRFVFPAYGSSSNRKQVILYS
jgi:hypothetical protein